MYFGGFGDWYLGLYVLEVVVSIGIVGDYYVEDF